MQDLKFGKLRSPNLKPPETSLDISELDLLQHPFYSTPPSSTLQLLVQERQESRCSLIFDSCTFVWHTGQLTISAEEEEEEEEGVTLCSPAEGWRDDAENDEVETALCCIAGVFVDSLCPAESLPNVFWKK